MKWITFDKRHLRRLNIEYQNAVFELENKLNNATNNGERKEIFNKFSNEFTVIPEIWKSMYYKFTNDHEYLCHLIKASHSHFYESNNNFKNTPNIFKNDYELYLNIKTAYKNCYYNLKNDDSEARLTIPHQYLEADYRTHVEMSDRPIPAEMKQKYKKAKKLSKRLKQCAENFKYQKFIALCFDYGDDKFAYQSIEYRLSRIFFDKNLWKSYINAAKDQNVKIMLNIYRRYTWLFLDDKEMKEKYEKIEKEKIQKYANFDSLLNLKDYLFDKINEENTKTPIKLPSNIFQNPKCQYFSFPQTYVTQILNSSNAKIRFKLFQTCKLLFIQKPTPICHQLIIERYKRLKSEYRKQSIHFQNSELNEKCLSKLYISNRLKFQFPDLLMLSKEIIPKLDKCQARYIKIFQQIITFKDFKFLVSTETKKFEYVNGGIIGRDGRVVPVENLLPELKFAYDIRLNFNEKYEFPTCHVLSNLKQKSKIRFLQLQNFTSLLDVDDYCNFILNNATKDATFNLAFGNGVTAKDAEIFDKAVAQFVYGNFFNKTSRYQRIYCRVRRSCGGRFHSSSKVGYMMWFLESNISKFNLPKPVVIL